jgi:hypothetical protein
MDSGTDSGVIAALFGLGGALVGGAASFFGTRAGARIQAEQARIRANQDATQWQLDRKQNAYHSTSRALLRVLNRRKRMAYPQLASEELPHYLEDLVEAQHGLSMVLTVCGDKHKDSLQVAIGDFDELVNQLLPPPPDRGPPRISLEEAVERIEHVRDAVLQAQKEDLAVEQVRDAVLQAPSDDLANA